MGLSTLIHVTLGREALRIYTLDRPALRAGDRAAILLDPDHLHVFDAATEFRLDSGAPT